jgi:histidine ammonia-lyase
MGAAAARKAAAIIANVERVIAIEAIAAAQGLDLRGPLAPAPATAAARSVLRESVPFLEEDRVLSGDIEAAADLIRRERLVVAAADASGALD